MNAFQRDVPDRMRKPEEMERERRASGSKLPLQEIAGAIAVAAGLPVDAVALYENDSGSFTVTVYGIEYTAHSLTEAIALAARVAREEADTDLDDGPRDLGRGS